jgi:hypothetical protein
LYDIVEEQKRKAAVREDLRQSLLKTTTEPLSAFQPGASYMPTHSSQSEGVRMASDTAAGPFHLQDADPSTVSFTYHPNIMDPAQSGMAGQMTDSSVCAISKNPLHS